MISQVGIGMTERRTTHTINKYLSTTPKVDIDTLTDEVEH